MNDLAAIRRAICVNPLDRVARLALADCLEEAGDVLRARWYRNRDAEWEAVTPPQTQPQTWGPPRMTIRNDHPEWAIRTSVRAGLTCYVECQLHNWECFGRAFVLANPIESVKILGWPPERHKRLWRWLECDGSQSVQLRGLRTDIFRHLPSSLAGRPAVYCSRASALADLNRGALAWARAEAGLPPMSEDRTP